MDLNMEIKDWITIIAILAGPVFAIQAQKTIQFFKERKQRKEHLFRTLMETRAARLSAHHVSALNMIDLEFYGYSFFGRRWQSNKDKNVIDSWRKYNDHLSNKTSDGELSVWFDKGTDLFTSLIYSISKALDYDFDEIRLKRGCYSPVAHEKIEDNQNRIRQGLVDLLEGNRSIPIAVTYLPAYQTENPTTEKTNIENNKE